MSKSKPNKVSVPQRLQTNFIGLPEHLTIEDLSLNSQTLSDVPSDIIIRSRIKYGNPRSTCKGLVMEYSKNTTIHGVRYLFEVHRPVYEKITWFLLLITSLCLAVLVIWDNYFKWQDTPVILGFDEKLVPVHKIPFPTITICPEIKSNSETFSFQNMSQQIWHEIEQSGKFQNNANLTEEQISQFAALLHICESDVIERFAQFIPNNMESNIAKTLVELSVSKNQTAPFCRWNRRFYFCDTILNFVATDEGICYQFNGLRKQDIYRDERYLSYNDEQEIDFNSNLKKTLPLLNNITGYWSLESGFIDQGFNAYPQRTIFSTARNGFVAFLQGFAHNKDYSCRSSQQSYKVFLNSPESVPFTSGNYILVTHGNEVIVRVSPHYIGSSAFLQDYSSKKRQCYFNDERFLQFFRSYSQSNCQTECLVNYTIAKCGCAKFWMPKPFDVPICNLKDIKCYSQAQVDLSLIIQNQTMQKILDPNFEIMCDCMPACTSLAYNFEITNANYDLNKLLLALRENYEHPDVLPSRLIVYFKETEFTAIKRTVIFSLTTFIANCGGIFGLFMGISSLSFIEIIFFFSVRLSANLMKRHESIKKLKDQVLEKHFENKTCENSE